MEPSPSFNFMSFDGMAMEDQQRLQSILYGEEKEKEEQSEGESPSNRHVFNVHAQVFVPKTTATPQHSLIGVPYIQFNNQQLMQPNQMTQQQLMQNHVQQSLLASNHLQQAGHMPQGQLQHMNHMQMNHVAQQMPTRNRNNMPVDGSLQQQQQQQQLNEQHGNFRSQRPRYQNQNPRYNNDRQGQADWGRGYGRGSHGYNKRITVLQNPNSRRYHNSRNDGQLPPRFYRQQRDHGHMRYEPRQYDEDINSNMLKLQNGLEPKFVDARSSPDESDDERIIVSLNSGAPSVSNVKWPSDDSKTCSPQSRSLSPASSAASEVKSPDSKRDSGTTQPKPADRARETSAANNSGEFIRTKISENNRTAQDRSTSAQFHPGRNSQPKYRQGKTARNDKFVKRGSSESSASLDGVDVRRRDFNILDDEWSQEFADGDDEWKSIEPEMPWAATGFSADVSPDKTKVVNSAPNQQEVTKPVEEKTETAAVKETREEHTNGRNNNAVGVVPSDSVKIMVEPVKVDNKGRKSTEPTAAVNTSSTESGKDAKVAPSVTMTTPVSQGPDKTSGTRAPEVVKSSGGTATVNPPQKVVSKVTQSAGAKPDVRATSAPTKAPTVNAKPAPPTSNDKPVTQPSGPSAAASGAPAPTPTPPTASAPPRKSWAALVSGNLPAQPAVVIREENTPPSAKYYEAASVRDVTPAAQDDDEVGDLSNDRLVRKLREYLRSASLHHRPPSVFPRGLINRANWCYVNATLQALLACPPFYNLFKNIPRLRLKDRGQSCTPVIDSICEFVHEFQFMKPQANRNKKQEQATIATGEPFVPDYVYKMLLKLKSTDAFKQGHQEDAEEFLTCVLNHMHDELLAISNNQTESKPEEAADESADWEQVGRKKKAIITRSNEMPRSLVSDIFCGQIRSVLRSSGSRESATLEPFFTLPLDIQHEKIRSVKDALTGLVSRESIQGFTCSKTKEEIEATRCIMLELLPPVLILHLKCFIYDKNGGCQKLGKEIEYTVDLEINKEIISQNARGKIRDHQRSYKLFAVVYHRGKTLQGGHYTTDVYHSGINGWIRIDDHNISVVPVSQVLQYTQPYMPYLLYYRRHDSLGIDRGGK